MAKRLKTLLSLIFLLLILCVSSTLLAQMVDPTLPTQPDSNILALDNVNSINDSSFKDGLRLNAIYFRTNHPVAIINGKVIETNEKIEGYKVVSIGRQSVKLTSSKGESVVLAIDNLDVKNFHRNS